MFLYQLHLVDWTIPFWEQGKAQTCKALLQQSTCNQIAVQENVPDRYHLRYWRGLRQSQSKFVNNPRKAKNHLLVNPPEHHSEGTDRPSLPSRRVSIRIRKKLKTMSPWPLVATNFWYLYLLLRNPSDATKCVPNMNKGNNWMNHLYCHHCLKPSLLKYLFTEFSRNNLCNIGAKALSLLPQINSQGGPARITLFESSIVYWNNQHLQASQLIPLNFSAFDEVRKFGYR